MSLDRREFLKILSVASSAGLSLSSEIASAEVQAKNFYDLPKFGNLHFLHFTDCHAQLNPIYFREPQFNIGVASQLNRPPHLVGQEYLKAFNIAPKSAKAYAFTHLDFTSAAHAYGKVGGFAHLATLVKQLRADRPGALLLDGGDTWQGSATALWTKGQDMVDAALLLGVDVMTAHWEMTLGAERVQQIVERDFKDKVSFIAQNIQTSDFGDPVFEPYVLKEMNGVLVAVIGQAFPYTPIANPRYFTPDWTFGIKEENLQKTVDEARSKGAKVVVLLSHNGMDVDLKLATRVRGIDAILGGHTHDGIAQAIHVKNAGGVTLVTNAGSNGKFLGVLDFAYKQGRITEFRYQLVPVFSNLIPADGSMQALINQVRRPYEEKLQQVLAKTDTLLYRRGNFNGTFDQLIVDGLMKVQDAPIAFSPGFRWGTTLLPGQDITMEHLMDQTAITYPQATVSMQKGEDLKNILEDVADNLFNPDPYYQQGGDMVRTGGLTYAIDPFAKMGNRISDMRINGQLLEASKVYKVAGWASVNPDVQGSSAPPVWDIISKYLADLKVVTQLRPNIPLIKNVTGNKGLSKT
ncbi:thiosulfohydrolase SoxB [Polynucleobacter kasalickyi]|uniref:Sulfate thiol esterase SoxB n=1 Tax=Polynucleobacter kasalickyi TaxID=1938817 RepID=A0A1W1Y9K5_9BURK|nr:thiosulfohydrolase SoxB [Polynucleobacter kasalickyi]SMC32428.1 sulfate thiol esterase SoxB [Polynucleobacter kasalickyi]